MPGRRRSCSACQAPIQPLLRRLEPLPEAWVGEQAQGLRRPRHVGAAGRPGVVHQRPDPRVGEQRPEIGVAGEMRHPAWSVGRLEERREPRLGAVPPLSQEVVLPHQGGQVALPEGGLPAVRQGGRHRLRHGEPHPRRRRHREPREQRPGGPVHGAPLPSPSSDFPSDEGGHRRHQDEEQDRRHLPRRGDGHQGGERFPHRPRQVARRQPAERGTGEEEEGGAGGPRARRGPTPRRGGAAGRRRGAPCPDWIPEVLLGTVLLCLDEQLLEALVGRLVGERHPQVPLHALPASGLRLGQRGRVELPSVGGLPELLDGPLLLGLLHGRLVVLREAELAGPVRTGQVAGVLLPARVVAQHRVGLVDAPVDAPDPIAERLVVHGGVAVGVVDPRLAVVGGADLRRCRRGAELQDGEVVELVERLGQRLDLDPEGNVHRGVEAPLRTPGGRPAPPRRSCRWRS